jgi:hypothetical protein
VHVRHELGHVVERGLIRLDDDGDAWVDGPEVVVRHDDGNLNEFVDGDIEAGHFAVDPDQQIRGGSHSWIVPPHREPLRGRALEARFW